MSEIHCPNCDEIIQAEIIQSIHEGDEAVKELFQGTLNILACYSCGKEFHHDSSIVFRSDDDSVVIFYNPELNAIDQAQAEAMMQQAVTAQDLELPDELQPDYRLCLSRNSFIEKIALVITEMDDKAIEYLKLQLYRQGEVTWPKELIFFDFNSYESENIDFVIIDKDSGKLLRKLAIPHESYEEILELDAESDNAQLDQAFSGLIISAEKHLG